MNDNQPKNYYVQLPGYQQGEIWDEEKYNRNKDKLFQEHKDAIVMETSQLNGDEEYGAGDMFTVHLPGFPEGEAWDAEKLSRNRDQLLAEHPDAEIFRATPVDYWGPRLDALNEEINRLKPQRESALAAVNQITLGDFSDMDVTANMDAARRQAAAQSDLDDVDGRLERLYREREENPAFQTQKQAKLQYYEDAAADIDDKIRQLNAENTESAKVRNSPTAGLARTGFGKAGDYGLAQDIAKNPDYYRDVAALNAAKMFYEDAKKVEKAPSRYDDSKGFANFFVGLVGEAPETISAVALGKSLAENIPLADALKSIHDAEGANANIVELVTQHPERLSYLSDAQKELVTAFVVKSATDWARAEDMSLGYQSGSTAMQSLGFMADFFLTGGIGDAAANWATKGITKGIAGASVKMGLKGAQRELVQAPVKFIEGTFKSAVKTLTMTPFMPSSYANLLDNLYKIDDSGQVDLSGSAIMDAVGDVLIENFSEAAGTQVEGILGMPFKLAGKGAGQIFSGTKFEAWGKALKNSPMAKIMKQAGWNGYVSEIGEEWYGNALRVMTGVDKDALKDFATVEQQIITLTSFAPMSIIGGGTSTAQFLASKKQVAESGEILSNLLKRNGYDDKTVQNFIDVTMAENPTALANKLAPVIVQAAQDNQDAPAVYKAVMDYAQAVARYRTFDGVSKADIEEQRQSMLDEINTQLGIPVAEDKAKSMESRWITTRQVDTGDGNTMDIQSVRVLTDAEGNEFYVESEDENGRIGVIPRNSDGKLHFFTADDIANGTLQDSGYMSLNDYLDRELVRKKQTIDNQRMAQEQQQNTQELMQRAQPGTQVNMGTAENPVSGTIVQFTAGQFIVQGEGGVKQYSMQEMANLLELPLTPVSQEQQEAAQAEEFEKQENLRTRANAMTGQNIAPIIGAQGELTLQMVHRPVQTDEGTRYQVDYMQDGQLAFDFLTEEQVTAIIGLAEQKPAAEVESEEQPAPKDETPRDFRGNPLPMRTNKQTNQLVVDGNALWNKDPEAWAHWNDNNPNARVGSKERLEYTLTELGKEIDKDTKSIQKAALKGIDEDEMDRMEAALGQKLQRRELLTSILNKYNLPVAAGPTVAGEQRKAVAEQVKQEQQAGFPGIQQKFSSAQKVQGVADEIRLPNGETVSGHYVLTEAEAPTPSHNPSGGFAMTEGFPVDENGKTVNDRDYQHDKAAQDSVMEKAANYDQRALQTPVIVSADGVVLSGNDRTMASQIAAANNTDKAYTDYLAKYSQKYGFSPDQVGQFKHPRVLFVPDAAMPYNAATFAKFNAEEKKSQSKAEKAVKAGKTLTPEAFGALASLVDRYEDINALYNDGSGVKELLDILLKAEVISTEQLPSLTDGNLLSGAGMDLLESTLIGAALEEEAVRIAMADKNIRKSVVSAIAQIIVGNTIADYNLRTELTDAVTLVANGKRANEVKFGESVQSYIRQMHLFQDDVVAEATVQMLADAINDRKTSFLKKVLSLYNKDAVESASGQYDLLSGDIPTKDAIIRQILNYLGYDIKTFDTFQRAAAGEQPAAEGEEPGGNQGGETGPAVQGGEESPVSQFNREEVAAILEQGNVGEFELEQYMTDEEIAEFMKRWEAFLPFNDALGEAYSRLDKDLHSSDKKVKKAAQAEIDRLEMAQEEAFAPVQEYVDGLLAKYELTPEEPEESVEEPEEDIEDVPEEGFEEEEPETKPKKGKKSSKKGKKEEEKPRLLTDFGGAKEAKIEAMEYSEEEKEDFIYGSSFGTTYTNKKLGLELMIMTNSLSYSQPREDSVRIRLSGGEGMKYIGEFVSTNDYIIKYLKANKYKRDDKTAGKKNKYGYWVNDCGVIMNPITVVLPSVHKGWANFQEVRFGRANDGKWSLAVSLHTNTGGYSGPVSGDEGEYDSKSDAIRAGLKAAEEFKAKRFKGDKSKSYEERDLDNLIRTLKTKTLPQALLEEGTLDNAPRVEITAAELDNGVQGVLFGEEEVETVPVAKKKQKRLVSEITEDEEGAAEDVFQLEDEEGTPGNYHWISERVCTNPTIITVPGQDKRGPGSKVVLAEKDGQWYAASRLAADGGKGSSWGAEIPTFKSSYIPHNSRYAAISHVIDSMRWLLDNQAKKMQAAYGETYNEAKELIDYLVKMELPKEDAKKQETTDDALAYIKKALDNFAGNGNYARVVRTLEAYQDFFGEDVAQEIDTILSDLRKNGISKESKDEMVRRTAELYNGLVAPETEDESVKEPVATEITITSNDIEEIYNSRESTKEADKGKPGRKEIVAALYEANPKLVQFRNEGDRINAITDVIELARQYPDLAISKNILGRIGQQVSKKPAAPAYGSQNTIVTTEKYEELKKRMMEKLGQLNAGFDPEMFSIGAQMAAYHVEAGAREFVDFAQRMIADLGDAIRPYLKAIYNGARDLPGMEGFKPEMDSAADVDGINVDEIGVAEETPAVQEPAQPVEAEAPKKAAVQQVDVNALFGAINDLARGKRDDVKISDYASEIQEARSDVDTAPTDAQKEAGNYKKGHISLDGYDISIENPKGSVRSGKDANGNEWQVTMNNDYGYIRMTEGPDGDHIDVFLSDNPTEGNVFVVDQVKEDGSFDEHKVMYGFASADEASKAYLANYSPGWKGLGTITEVSKEEFKKWVQSSHRKTKPFAEYKSVNALGGQSSGNIGQLGEMGKYTHTKTGEVLSLVKLTGERVSDDEFKRLKARAKQFGGYYSKFAKGFLFDNEKDAIKFNTIESTQNAEEQTDEQTAADTTAIVSEAASVAEQAQSLAEAESPSGQEAAEVIESIDATLDAIDDQLALLGYYEADQTSPFHESYGYMKSAEKKAVKDAEKLAKKLAKDLGIEVGRKKLASANIAPAGGDVTFRLPLNEGRELYVDISVHPDYNRAYGESEDSLVVSGVIRGLDIMYRVENPDAKGSDRYGRNYFAMYNVSYDMLLRGIRNAASEYLPEAPAQSEAPADLLQVAKEQAEKSRKSKKKSVSSQEEGDAMLGGLFADLSDDEQDVPDVVESPAPAARVKPTEINGFSIGEKVLYTPSQGDRKPQIATIYDFEYDGRPVLDAGLAPILYEVVNWDQIQKNEDRPIKDTDNGLQRPDESRAEGTPAESVQPGGGAAEAEGGNGGEAGQESGAADSGRAGGSQPAQRNTRRRYDDSVKRNTHNNRVLKGEVVYPKTTAARYKANIEAIKLLKELQDTGKKATKEQMAVLRQYTGWGGLGGYFNNEYSPEHRELKSLLTDEEMQAAELSINTAYYTPVEVIDAMWDIAKRLGFEGGNVLEGSAGIGNILASMPKNISEHSEITAVELDNITGGILELLYPDAKVMIKGFEEADIPNNSVDLAITNVPFGDIQMYDAKEKDLTRKFGGKIHDFCIAKNIRKLSEGGIGIFISTRGTLDNSSKALRQWIVNEGGSDVIGAFRLNNKTFEGTGATSDIIVVRKRVGGKVSPNAIDVSGTEITRRETYSTGKTEWNSKTRSYEPITAEGIMELNSYFVEHPENMGGEMGFGFEHNDSYRPGSVALWPTEKIDQTKRLNKWAKQFSSMQQEEQAKASSQQSAAVEAENTDAAKEGQIVVNSKGDICLNRKGKAVPIGVNAQKVKGYSKAQAVGDYNALKSAINEVLDYQLKNETDEGLKPLLAKLNRAYDTFRKRYGQLNRNTAISFLRNDVDFPAIAAVEDYKEAKDINGKVTVSVKKTGIFNGRVLGAKRVPTPSSAKDGVIVSMNQFGRIDIPFIAEALRKNEDDVRSEILSSGLGFENPRTGNIEVEYEYLSGNVREKLEYAREHNQDGRYDANVKALEKVIPTEIPAHLIEFSLGSDWLPLSLYTEYGKEKFGLNDNFVPQKIGSSWVIPDYVGINENNEKNRAAGVVSNSLGMMKTGHELMLAAMNKTTVQFSKTYKDSEGTSHTEHDKNATQAAATKIDEMRDDFKEWCRAKILADNDLSEKITKTYNDTFNAIVPKEIRDTFLPEHFEGQVLEMGGKPFHLYPHQAKAVIRATTEPLMMAHEVGTGKTFTLITSAMEMRRLGTAKKPMIVVQNATLGQFVSSAKALYPNAKVLTISEADRTVEGRAAFYAKIKYNDWDMIIVPQSVFEMIPDSEERQRAFIQEKIDEKKFILEQAKQAKNSAASRKLEEELKDLEYERDHNGEKRPKKGRDAKKAAEAIANAAAKAKKQLDRRTDDVSDFDDMGIDALLIDEAHAYKHLGFSTAMQRGVKGVDPSYSKKSAGVYMKTRAVFEKVGWKNVVFATGTPISNTAAEIWTFMKYLMPDDVMRSLHIYYFDDFVSNFGNISQSLEFTTSGKFKENARFASYTNLPELIRIWSSVTDTVLTREAVAAKAEDGVVEKLDDKVPTLEVWTDEKGEKHEGQVRDIYLPQSAALVDIMTAIRAKLEWYEGLSGKEKKENSYIPLTMFGLAKMAAIDPRLVDRNAKDEPLSKTNRVVEETLKALDDSKKYNGTAALFCDNFRRWDYDGKGNRVEGFNIFEEIRRKLIDRGVPADQIVIMKSGMTTAAKEKIFARVNAGDVRVIMGTTATLGTGVNIQERLFFEGHIDAPNRPMDYTQRMGRILRQGNLHKQWGIPVRVVRFGVEDSLDVTAYQRLATKSRFINSIMDGKPLIANGMENRILEEDEEGEFDNPVAVLSGSQYALLKSQAERELRKLRNKKEQHRQDQIYIERQLKENASRIDWNEAKIKDGKQTLSKVREAFPDGKVSDIVIAGRKVSGVEQINAVIKEKVLTPIRETIDDEKRKAERTSWYSGWNGMREFTIKFNGVTAKVNADIRVTSGYDYEKHKNTVSASVFVSYTCPDLGIEFGINMPGGLNGVKDIIDDFSKDIATGRMFENSIASSEARIGQLKSDNELMRQRRGKPFADEDKLQRQEEIVKDYTEKMRAELAEKEKKYAEMAKNATTSFNLDDVEVDDEDEGDEISNEFSDFEGKGFFSGIEDRRDGEDAYSFTNRIVNAVTDRYPFLKGKVVVTDAALSLTPEEQRKASRGLYSYKSKKITIFALDNQYSADGIENTVFHEAVHMVLDQLGWHKDKTFVKAFNLSLVATGYYSAEEYRDVFSDMKATYEERQKEQYSNDSIREEITAEELSGFMVSGFMGYYLGYVRKTVPQLAESLDKILKTLGYGAKAELERFDAETFSEYREDIIAGARRRNEERRSVSDSGSGAVLRNGRAAEGSGDAESVSEYDREGRDLDLEGVAYRLERDPETLERLEAGRKRTGFRNVDKKSDGVYGSPMAGKLGKRGAKSISTSPFTFEEWERSEENPDMATDDGKINLIKPRGRGSVDSVDYNPYIHIRPTTINRQFTQAWMRPELVYIETAYPESELKSGYHAQKAKLPVGRHPWTGGDLILSRWDKPLREVPWEEVADDWVKEYRNTGVTFDIVPPGLLPVLVERGIEILPPKIAAGKRALHAYQQWRESNPVRNRVAYHGSLADFEAFDSSHAGEGEGFQSHGFGHYVAFDKDTSVGYAWSNAFDKADRDGQIEPGIAQILRNDTFDDYDSMVERYDQLLAKRKAEVAKELEEERSDKTPDMAIVRTLETEQRLLEKYRPLREIFEGMRNVYTVEIPEDTGDNYIDEMRTLSKDGRRRIAAVVREISAEKLDRTLHGPNWLPQGFQTLANVIEREQYAGLEIRRRLVDALGNTNQARRETSEILRKAGFVGMTYDGRSDGECAVIFSDSDLRIVGHERFRTAGVEGFISNAEAAVNAIRQEKASPEQWLRMIEKNGGLKAGEDKWLGLSDWLKAQNGKSLTKQEVLDYILDNRIELEEVQYGGSSLDYVLKHYPTWEDAFEPSENWDGSASFEINDPEEAVAIYNRMNPTDKIEFNFVDELSSEDEEKLIQFAEDVAFHNSETINDTRLQYTTEGLEDKREIALVVPTIEPWKSWDEVHFGDAGSGRAIAWARFGTATITKSKEEIERLKAAQRAFVDEMRQKYGTDNPLRLLTKEERDRLVQIIREADNTPRKVLFIDEIQSNRHQEGREKGYTRELTEQEKEELYQLKKEYPYITNPMIEKYGQGIVNPGNWKGWPEVTEEDRATMAKSETMRQRIQELENTPKEGVPAAPFEKNWHELTMKRMLRYAAENGFDYIAWTTGDQQAERYDLGQVVSGIEWHKDFTAAGNKIVHIDLKNNSSYKCILNSEGVVTWEEPGVSNISHMYGKNIGELVGKEAAVKIMSSNSGNLEGEGLCIGGEGMRGFYDEILPRFMNKYGKKWGVSTKDMLVPLVGGAYIEAHSVEVTPEMKESVLQGQMMFRPGAASTPSPVSYSESMGAKRLAASETARKCGIDIEFRPSSQMQFGGKPLAGRWINGKMLICLEHCRDNNDAIRTVLHEGVGHNGLRKLIGDANMVSFCMDLYRSLPEDARMEIATDAVNNRYDFAEATEEYLARRAEVMDFENESYERSFWDIVRDALRRVLAKIGINVPLSERDVRWLLWQSYNANRQSDMLNQAKRQVVAKKLGFTLQQQAAKADTVQLVRNRVASQTLAPAARIYNKDVLYWLNRLHETWVDKDNAVHLLVKAIEKATGKAAAAFEDVRLALNQQSSKGLAAIEKFEREYWEPMQSAIKSLMTAKGCDLHAIERYVMLKHGLERNEVFAKRDAREYYRDLHDTAVKMIQDSDKIDDITKLALIAKEDAKLEKHYNAVEAGTDSKYREFREQDYGGLTAMYSEYDAYEPFMEGVESEEEFQARVRQARHPKYTYIDENGREQVDMAATEDAAKAEVAEFENGYDRGVDELWKRINAATKHTIKHQYDANMMSREQYSHVKDMFKYYVPLRGFAEKTAEDMYDYYMSDQRNDFTPPLLKAKGRKTEAESPFGYIGSMASSGIAADMKNDTKLSLYYFVSNRADNDLVSISEVWYKNTGVDELGRRIFTPVYPPFKEDLSREEAKQAYEDWEKQMQEEAKAGFAFKGRRKLNLHNAVIHIDKRQETSHIIKFKVGGRDMMMYINGNPRAAQAINNELNVEMSTDYQMVFGKILRWFSGINTSYNPEFWLSNAQRDTLFALMSVSAKEGDEYNAVFRKNLGSLLRHTLTPGTKEGAYSLKKRLNEGKLGNERLDRLYQEFVENGGVTGYTTLKNNEEWELELRKYTGDEKKAIQAVKKGFEKVQQFGEAIEQMTRFAAYVTSRDMGKEVKDAVNDAKELTVNFNRKGSGKAISFKEAARLRTKSGKKLTPLHKAFVVGASWLPVYGRRFIMFFNASTQGLNAMYKLYKKNPGRMGTWTAAYLALGVMQAVMHALLDDDDDYLDIPDYERRNNLLLGGDGVYFKWALPQEARIFYALGDMVVNHAMGREPHKTIAGELAAAASDIAPLNPAGGISALAPSAVVPILEVALNRDYKGAKIFNDLKYLSDEERKRTPAYQKAYQGTGKPYILLSQFANWLTGGDYADAGWLNINPAAVEHILQGATGGAGTTIGKLYRGTVGQVLGEDFMVRNTPFLSRILTVNDERYRNAHTTELFDYYKAEAEHTKKLINTYRKNGDSDKLDRVYESEDFEVMSIYDSYQPLLKWYNEELKATTDKDDRRALMHEQDAVRKEMLLEISNIGKDD